MRRSLASLLVDPITRSPLSLSEGEMRDGEILTGTLSSAEGSRFPIDQGIPRFHVDTDASQAQTEQSFDYKWRQVDTYESPGVLARARSWLLSRYGFETVDDMRRYFAERKRILDAGCGGGYTASLWMTPQWSGREWVGVDISGAVEVARERLSIVPNTHFVQADLFQLPFGDGTFDTIYAEGVLHHTPSTECALKGLVRLLELGGELMFYVYRKKAPVREFADDYVRDAIAGLDPAAAWKQLRSLTRLGEALAKLRVDVEVPEDVEILGIPAGRYDIQRLIYWHFAKLFWNDAMSFEENHHVNFDWYHPRYAHRQTEEEVRSWCDEAGLRIDRFHVEESGFTVRTTRM